MSTKNEKIIEIFLNRDKAYKQFVEELEKYEMFEQLNSYNECFIASLIEYYKNNYNSKNILKIIDQHFKENKLKFDLQMGPKLPILNENMEIEKQNCFRRKL